MIVIPASFTPEDVFNLANTADELFNRYAFTTDQPWETYCRLANELYDMAAELASEIAGS